MFYLKFYYFNLKLGSKSCRMFFFARYLADVHRVAGEIDTNFSFDELCVECALQDKIKCSFIKKS